MAESPQHHRNRIERSVDELRARALFRLEATANNALDRSFGAAPGPGGPRFVRELAQKIAADMTALGLNVHDADQGTIPAGVWLAPAADTAGIIVTWTQHEASAAVLGGMMHAELQARMNLVLTELLLTLGYPVERYGPGQAALVTGFRLW